MLLCKTLMLLQPTNQLFYLFRFVRHDQTDFIKLLQKTLGYWKFQETDFVIFFLENVQQYLRITICQRCLITC